MPTPPTHRRLALLLLATSTVLAACGDDGESASGDGGAQSGGAGVVIELLAFEPETLEIDAGTTVTWEQLDPGSHTVTSGTVEQGGAGVTADPDGRFDSGSIATGEVFEFTFEEAGSYPYFCALHPATMRGEIRVS